MIHVEGRKCLVIGRSQLFIRCLMVLIIGNTTIFYGRLKGHSMLQCNGLITGFSFLRIEPYHILIDLSRSGIIGDLLTEVFLKCLLLKQGYIGAELLFHDLKGVQYVYRYRTIGKGQFIRGRILLPFLLTLLRASLFFSALPVGLIRSALGLLFPGAPGSSGLDSGSGSSGATAFLCCGLLPGVCRACQGVVPGQRLLLRVLGHAVAGSGRQGGVSVASQHCDNKQPGDCCFPSLFHLCSPHFMLCCSECISSALDAIRQSIMFNNIIPYSPW